MYVNTFYTVRNLLDTLILNDCWSSYKMDIQFVKTQTYMGKECLTVDVNAFCMDSILSRVKYLKQNEMQGENKNR